MLALFSTLTAMTSTPRVIQLSTTSFCLAGSRSVGPSQMSVTPSSRAASSAPFRQLTKYGSPLAFGIIATVIARAAAPGDGAPNERRAGPACIRSSERTSHQLLDGDDQCGAPVRRRTEQRAASCA